MKIRQIRNATLLIEYGGVKFLVGPMLSAKSAWPAFAGTANDHLRNPTVDLVVAMEEILDVDAVIVRTMPPGSLEQVVVRMDWLARLEASGVRVINPIRK